MRNKNNINIKKSSCPLKKIRSVRINNECDNHARGSPSGAMICRTWPPYREPPCNMQYMNMQTKKYEHDLFYSYLAPSYHSLFPTISALQKHNKVVQKHS